MSKQTQGKKEEDNFELIFNLAVVIMGTISCYTTAVGVEPMLGIKLFAFGLAVALSLFMIAIALSFPKAKQEGRIFGVIFAYSIVAIFSVILNFNAIYGLFNKQNVLYDEINDKREALVALKRNAIDDINTKFEVNKWKGEVEAVKEKLLHEDKTPGDKGKGPRYKQIYRDELRPAEAKLKEVETNAAPYTKRVNQKITDDYIAQIDAVIQDGNPKKIKTQIEKMVATYQDVSKDIGPVTAQNYGSISFENKNVGNLIHAVKKIIGFFDENTESKAAIFISLLISFIIDFLILFVILFLAPPVENIRKKKNSKLISGPNWGRNKPKGGNSMFVDRD